MQIALAPGGGPTGVRVGVRGGGENVRVTFGVITDGEAVGVIDVPGFSSLEQATASANSNTALSSATIFMDSPSYAPFLGELGVSAL